MITAGSQWSLDISSFDSFAVSFLAWLYSVTLFWLRNALDKNLLIEFVLAFAVNSNCVPSWITVSRIAGSFSELMIYYLRVFIAEIFFFKVSWYEYNISALSFVDTCCIIVVASSNDCSTTF